MKKILVVATGGTIGAKNAKNEYITNDEPLKILSFVKKRQDVIYECLSPFNIFSENIDISFLKKLADYFSKINFDLYNGVILLHGSDTLCYTGAVFAQLFANRRIVLVASNKVLEDKTSNGIKNFENAVDFLLNEESKTGVFISYDSLHPAYALTSADCTDTFREVNSKFCKIENPAFNKKNILVIEPFVSIKYEYYNIEKADVILHTMYHSATVPQNTKEFAEKCRKNGKEFFFVTHKSSAQYETAKDLKNIIFSSTLESAFAKILLTN